MNELIAAVRAHAEANWDKDGWDFLVECWDDAEIAEVIGNAKSAKSAIANCKRIVKTLHLHRQEQQMGWW